MKALGCAAALTLAGCAANKNAKDLAVDAFADQFRCDASRVQAQPQESGWAVSGCGTSATCDVVRGAWGCQPAVAPQAEAPHLRAWSAVVARSRCPASRVIPTRQSNLGPGDAVVQLDACGTPWSCRVAPGGVSCGPGAASAGPAGVVAAPSSARPERGTPPPSSASADTALPPPPPGASSRPPPPTAVPALSTGAPPGPSESSRPPPGPPTAASGQSPPPGGASRPPPPAAPATAASVPPPPTAGQPPPGAAMTPEPWPGILPVSEDCVPRCRSGYVCEAGSCVAGCNPPCGPAMVCYRNACVSACNPPCDDGQQCTAEGECVRLR